jgi:hypothetical protein
MNNRNRTTQFREIVTNTPFRHNKNLKWQDVESGRDGKARPENRPAKSAEFHRATAESCGMLARYRRVGVGVGQGIQLFVRHF